MDNILFLLKAVYIVPYHIWSKSFSSSRSCTLYHIKIRFLLKVVYIVLYRTWSKSVSSSRSCTLYHIIYGQNPFPPQGRVHCIISHMVKIFFLLKAVYIVPYHIWSKSFSSSRLSVYCTISHMVKIRFLLKVVYIVPYHIWSKSFFSSRLSGTVPPIAMEGRLPSG